jgi:hypothetical protein
MLVKVWTELSSGKMTSLLAKIIEESGPDMTIQYLSPTDDLDHGQVIFRYEDETYIVQDDSITEYLGTDDESEAGFKVVPTGFVKYDSDSDYVPSDESESEDEESVEESDYSVDEE